MIKQLQKRLERYIKQSEKNDEQYRDGKKTLEAFYKERFSIDKKINGVFELDAKRIEEQEFTERQLNLWFDDKEEII